MSSISEKQVLDHYLERAQAEVDFVQAHAAELAEQFDVMPSTRSLLSKYGDGFDETFFLGSRTPTPLLDLACSLQFDINAYPSDMKSSAVMLGGFVLPALNTTTSNQVIEAR